MYRLIIIASLLVAGCAGPQTEVRDQPIIERLRIQISKARNAIEETRSAIAEARGAPHLPELYIRLAELMSDEAQYHYQVAYEREQRAGKTLHVPQVRFLKLKAVGLYELVLDRYPGTHLAPRALYNIGQEHRELGSYDKMREALQRLAKAYPNSDLRRDALLILGDDQFDRNKLSESAKYYKQMLAGPIGRLSGLAHFKLAWVHVNQAECKPALAAFEKAIVTSQSWFSRSAEEMAKDDKTKSQIDVRREALVDLVYCFTQERKPEEAVPYLKKHAYSRGAYVAALERLSSRFGTMDQASGAIEVSRELLTLGPDASERVDDARMLHAALRKTKTYDELGSDVNLIARAVLRQVRKPGSPAEERARLLEELEVYIRDLATRAQEALAKMAGVKKSTEPETRRRRERSRTKPADIKKIKQLANEVARTYRLHLQTFPESDFVAEMLSNLVDVYSMADDRFNAGRRAIEVAPLLPDSAGCDKLAAGDIAKCGEKEQAAECEAQAKQEQAVCREAQTNAWYDGLVSLQKVLETDDDRMRRVIARAGVRRAGEALLTRTLPTDKARKVQFAVARADYDEGNFDTAIDRLNAVALEHPGTPEGNTSVQLVLDAYRTVNDYLGLIRTGHRLMAEASPVVGSIKQTIAPIVKAAEQHQLDELALSAAGVDGGDVTGDLEQFAQTYAGSDLGERALINALLASRAAGDSQGLYRLAAEIEEKYPKSEQLPGIRSTVARTAAARFELDRALDFFRRAADNDPAQRAALLVSEGTLRIQLSDPSGAREAFTQALASADSPAARAQAASPLARLLEQAGDPSETIKVLGPMAGDGNPDVLAALGMAQVKSGNPDEGEATLQQVLDVGAAASTEARARAYYGQAEVSYQLLREFDPEGDVEAIQELVTLVELTQEGYLKAAREGSPVYTAASFGRLGHMSQTQAVRFRNLKFPDTMEAEVRAALTQGFGKRADYLKRQTKDALTACAEQGWIHHIFHPAVRTCLAGQIPAKDPVTFDGLSPRQPATDNAELAPLRARVSKNPEDVEALVDLGNVMLAAGDSHAARLVYARAAAASGGPIEANLLGIASFQSGDHTGGLEAFARAAAGGLDVGRQNLQRSLIALGLEKASAEVMKRFTSGRTGGRAFSPEAVK